MDTFTRGDLQRISSMTAEPALSIYMPTYRAGREVRQNATRLKNLLNQARQQLDCYGLEPRQIDKMLEEISKLEADDNWWQNQSDGLAMFVAPDRFERYRLPLDFSELVTVAKRFHVRPVVSLLQSDGRFYVLAVSQNRVRLLEATRYGVEELHPAHLPTDLRSALNVDEYVSTLQQHSTSTPRVAGGMMFHGQGGADMDVRKRSEIVQFFHRIDAALTKYFGGDRTPLLFAGVDYLFPLFRETCDYHGLVDDAVSGNPDDLTAMEIHEQAWRVMEPRFAAERDAALGRYRNAASGELAESDVVRIMRAARSGAIETLVVSAEAQRWGIIDEHSGAVQLTNANVEGAEELLNYAAVQTLIANGTVFSVSSERLPHGEEVVALLRYPLPFLVQRVKDDLTGQPEGVE
jgi:hypothetical protein